MSLPIILIRVDVELTSPWAIGGVAAHGDEVALPVLRDPHPPHLPLLPATSLVGSLRRHLGQAADAWLGPDTTAQEPTASPLRCLGTRLTGLTEIGTRWTTAIDPDRAAAKGHALRGEDVVLASSAEPTAVHWWLQLDQSGSQPVAELLTALLSWRLFVGRRRSVGQGVGEVTEVSYASLDLGQTADLQWWLGTRSRWDGVSEESSPPGWAPFVPGDDSATLVGTKIPPITVEFEVDEPLFVGSDHVIASKTEADIKVSLDHIPGSAWKGLFHHRIRHILHACGADPQTEDRIAGGLFGKGRERAASVDGGERGALRFQSSQLAADAPMITRTHIAIDRVTGGVRDRSGRPAEDAKGRGGALFPIRSYAPGTEVPLVIELTRELSSGETNLLRHVIRDIEAGLLGVGAMTSRGYGTLRPAGAPARPQPVIIAQFVPDSGPGQAEDSAEPEEAVAS